MKLYYYLKSIWHYIKCALILKMEITNGIKRQFYFFGEKSIIKKPLVQLSGIEKISVGKKTTILEGSRLAVYGNSEKKEIVIKIGDGCYLGYMTSILACDEGTILIGDNVLFASNVIVTNENHGMNPESDFPYMDQELTCKSISIGDGCWIGEKVCILSGVTIGEKSIVGAGSVVTKSLPEYCIAAGNPAKVIKKYNFHTHSWERVEGKSYGKK